MVNQVIQGRTKVQLRQAIGYNALGPRFWESTCTTNGTTTTLTDTRLRGGADDKNGHFVIFGTGTDLGTVAVVTDDDGAGVLTFTPAVNTDSVASGDTYELWPDDVDPRMVHSFMDDSVIEVTGRVFDPEEDISIHLHPDELRYDIPSQFKMISKLEIRTSMRSVLLDSCDAVWGTINANTTATVDSEVQRRGSAMRMDFGAISSGDLLATQAITEIDISRYSHVEFWARCESALIAEDYEVSLNNSTSARDALASAAFSAADTWEYQRLAVASPETNTDIDSLRFISRDSTTLDNQSFWIDELIIMDNGSAVWKQLNTNLYRIDVQARDIVFRNRPPYALMKITGGDIPVLFTADTTVTEVDDFYVIAYTTAAILGVLSDGSTNATRRLGQWEQRLSIAKNGFPPLINVRKLS